MTESSFITSVTELPEKNILREEDSTLISSFKVDSGFNSSTDRIDLYVYSIGDIIEEEGYFDSIPDQLITFELSSSNFKVVRQGSTESSNISTVELNIEQDVTNLGFDGQDVIFTYRFNRNLFRDNINVNPTFFIDEISEDRTELKCYSILIDDETILRTATDIKDRFTKLTYLDNIVVDFGSNETTKILNIGTYIERDKVFLLLKLYEPLSQEFQEKFEFELLEEISDPLSFLVRSEFSFQESLPPLLKGPNFNIDILDDLSNPSEFKSKEDILLAFTGSNYQAYSLLEKSSISISIDHTDFLNFIHFSSAEERIKNFKYKLGKIQEYQRSLVSSSVLSTSLNSGSKEYYENLVKGVISNFDHFDRFLYFESGSYSWPKVSNSYPYTNEPTGSTQAINWFESKLVDASFFDANNPHRLLNTIPTYLKDDESNLPYNLFIDMIGEFFDNQWIYAKAVTDRYDNDNRLNYGISRELVADALKGMGVKIYGNDMNFENLFSMFTGEFYLTGSEDINYIISASNIPTPIVNYQQEIYKRLYHNIPLLVKSKGTERGLRALINSYGIPKNFLDIRYYGGRNPDITPFFSDSFAVTSSLDKIRLDNTGSAVEGNTLSFYTSINQYKNKYSQDLHTIEVGFSPSNNINNYLISSSLITGSFDIDDYIGDPRFAYNSSYNSLQKFTETIFSGSINSRYDLYDFIRLVKFYDNTLFKTIKDFVPARTNTYTGLVIKPHILERAKIKQVQPKWSKQTISTGSTLDYVGSEYEKNFIYEGSIDLLKVSGGSGGAFNSGSVSGSNSGFTFFKEYDTRFTYDVVLPNFTVASKTTHDEAKYNGEFAEIKSKKNGNITYSQQSYTVTNGELNDENVFKRTNLKPYYYLLRALQTLD